MKIRLNKYLSEVGHCSRRNADKLIKEGKVTVNNIIAELGAKVVDDDQIVVEGTLIKKIKLKWFIWHSISQKALFVQLINL